MGNNAVLRYLSKADDVYSMTKGKMLIQLLIWHRWKTMNKSNHKHTSFWNIIQKLSFAVFFVCVSYLIVSTVFFSWTTPINGIERWGGPQRFMSNSGIVLVAAVVSLIIVFISTKLKNKN